jgi:peptide/nickel transport system permease protein
MAFIIMRILLMIPTLIVISVIAFLIIDLPPGDFTSYYIAQLEEQGEVVSQDRIESLKLRFGVGQPIYTRYFKWIMGILLRGDFGNSLAWRRPVAELIGDRIPLTFVVAFCSMLFAWIVAFPIGVYSAVRQYSIGDHVFTFVGFLGLSIPNFLLALVLMFIAFRFFGANVGGLFSVEFTGEPWSFAKFIDLLKHLWIPVVVVGTAGTAGTIRVLRANLLDELRKPYVITARAKGMTEIQLLIKYPIRIAINPFISTVGWMLPRLISGSTITAVVLSLPTSGPLLLQALKQQDMYLAGTFILLLSTFTVIGTLISDILLAMIDPRIRYE